MYLSLFIYFFQFFQLLAMGNELAGKLEASSLIIKAKLVNSFFEIKTKKKEKKEDNKKINKIK